MSCENYREWITGYVDDELPAPQREQLEDHLRACEACQRELKESLALKEHLTMIKFKEPSDAELNRYWGRIYNRLERGVGWILFSLGAIVMICWGAFEAIE
ncbi:MAG: zf-HC2 domain-containing protein, partial [Planctomycetota bacterium]